MADKPNPEIAIALNRFGLGARPEDSLPASPRQWLMEQFQHYQPLPPAWQGQQTTTSLVEDYADQQRDMRDMAEADKADARKMLRRETRDVYMSAVNARMESALTTDTPFVERLVHFWSNHFAVSIEKPMVVNLAGAFEAEAIRPHVLGRFEDMLIAVEQHPAMLIYLDQVRSIGPNSPAAIRAERKQPEKQRGLNENLAREILELHTLGVRSGYSQDDVTEFARAMTGWSTGGLSNRNNNATPDGFVFRPQLHEPGERRIIGRTYAQRNENQALAVMHDLARADATAHHIAEKLARHFISDTPPDAAVTRIATAFRNSGGDLPTVYRALIDAPESWATPLSKFKTPWEWTVSLLRGLGQNDLKGMRAGQLMNQLGQTIWKPGSPAGYDDTAASWAAPDALVRRVEAAQRFASHLSDRIDPRALAQRLLPGTLSDSTATAIARAESTVTGLALLLVSPDFQRR